MHTPLDPKASINSRQPEPCIDPSMHFPLAPLTQSEASQQKLPHWTLAPLSEALDLPAASRRLSSPLPWTCLPSCSMTCRASSFSGWTRQRGQGCQGSSLTTPPSGPGWVV